MLWNCIKSIFSILWNCMIRLLHSSNLASRFEASIFKIHPWSVPSLNSGENEKTLEVGTSTAFSTNSPQVWDSLKLLILSEPYRGGASQLKKTWDESRCQTRATFNQLLRTVSTSTSAYHNELIRLYLRSFSNDSWNLQFLSRNISYMKIIW